MSACHTCSQVTMAHPQGIHARGCCLQAFNGLCSSSIEQDAAFAGEKLVLSGAVMSSPRGLPEEGECSAGRGCLHCPPQAPTSPCSAQTQLRCPTKATSATGQVLGTQQWPQCPEFLWSGTVTPCACACWDLSALRAGATQASKQGHKSLILGFFFLNA